MRVSLTEKGKAAEADNRARANLLEQELLAGLSEAERAELTALLTTMEDNLHRTLGLPHIPQSPLGKEKTV